MRLRGIHYDVGTLTLESRSTRPTLNGDELERDIGDIARGLQANAVRVTGGDVSRLAEAADVVARHGLEAWITPMIPNADATTTLARITESADVAESIRCAGAPVTLIVGCELSAFMRGILPGATHGERLALLTDPARLVAEVGAAGIDPQALFDAFLREAADTARRRFRGQIAYASGMWETVDWSLFDVVGVDAYRDANNHAGYADALRALAQRTRPLVITEFGCATHAGAAAAGGMAWTAMNRTTTPFRLNEGVVRDEHEQARELASLLELFDSIGADGAFVYTYDAPSYPSSTDPILDLDAASYALVRTWSDSRQERKEAYRAVSEIYGSH